MLITGRGSSDWESTRLNSNLFEGEAEDRVVGSSSLPRGTTDPLLKSFFHLCVEIGYISKIEVFPKSVYVVSSVSASQFGAILEKGF